MQKTLPDTDIRADPQIKSKITVWKKTYSHLYTMFDNSGDGAKYNEDTQMKYIVTEDWWTEYIRVRSILTCAHCFIQCMTNSREFDKICIN